MEDDLDSGEAVGTGNDARVAMLERINDANDGLRADELANINDDGTTEAFSALTPSDDNGVTQTELDRMTAEVTEDPAPVEQPQLITRKINGRDVSLTLDDWLVRASKVEAADQYLSEAARLRRDAETAQVPPEPAAPSQQDARARQDEERRAWVRALQMGSEDDAMAALEQLQNLYAQPKFSHEDLARTVDERLTFKEAVSKFETTYSDILQDPQLKSLALQRDQQLLASGDKRGYWERYDEIGRGLRDWRDGLVKAYAPAPTPAADPIQAKQAAKADAARRAAPAGANGVKAQSAANSDEPEESVSDVIANIAKARGGPQWSRA